MQITNVKLIVSSVAQFSTIASKIAADGKVDLMDLAQVPALLGALTPLASLEFSQVLPEVKDLDANELSILSETFAQLLDLPDDKMEIKVEAGLKLVGDLFKSVTAFLAVLKK